MYEAIQLPISEGAAEAITLETCIRSFKVAILQKASRKVREDLVRSKQLNFWDMDIVKRMKS